MDDLDLVVKAQDKEFWDKVAEELKPTIKRALEETFSNSERNDILQKRLADYPMLKEQKCEWYAACNNCIDGSNYWKKESEEKDETN